MENTPTITMRGVIWSKMICLVREYTLLDAIKFAIYSFVVGLMCATAVDGGDLATRISEWRGGAIPNVTLILTISYFAPRFLRTVWLQLKESVAEMGDDAEEYETEQTIEGMNTAKVIDHLINRSTFKREEIEKKFEVPRYRYSALVKKLKELDVLVTGENNMSVFNSQEWNRAQLEELFAGKETAAELEKGIKIVRPLPSPTAFRKRPVSCATQCAAPRATGVQPDVRQLCSPCAA